MAGPADQQEPVASVEGITLFGEVDGREAVPFVAQSARSLQQHTFASEGRDFDPDVSRTGELMVFASTRHSVRPDIYLKSVTGSTVAYARSARSLAHDLRTIRPAFLLAVPGLYERLRARIEEEAGGSRLRRWLLEMTAAAGWRPPSGEAAAAAAPSGPRRATFSQSLP